MSEALKGRVEAVLILPPDNDAKAQIQEEVEVAWEGFVGDKHFGATKRASSSQKAYPKGTEVRNTRQVSIVSLEELKEVAQALGVPRVEPDWVGANLMVSGIPNLTKLPPGTRFHFSDGVGLVVEGENMPCTTAGKTVQANYPGRDGLTRAFPKFALGKRGLVAWVERPGRIRAGEDVQVSITEYSVHS